MVQFFFDYYCKWYNFIKKKIGCGDCLFILCPILLPLKVKGLKKNIKPVSKIFSIVRFRTHSIQLQNLYIVPFVTTPLKGRFVVFSIFLVDFLLFIAPVE